MKMLFEAIYQWISPLKRYFSCKKINELDDMEEENDGEIKQIIK